MARTLYISSYKEAQRAFSTVRTPDRGKPLGTTNQRLTYAQNIDTFFIHYGSWSHKFPNHENKLYSIDAGDVITTLIDFNYDGRLNNHISRSSRIRYMQMCHRYLRCYYKNTLSQPGFWHDEEAPIFPGFKMQGNKVLTPKVFFIEEHMDILKKQCAIKGKELTKLIRLYAKFDAFKGAEEEVCNIPEMKNHDSAIIFRADNDFSTVGTDIKSLRLFMGLRSGFGAYTQTYAGLRYRYSHSPTEINYDAHAAAVVKQSILRHLATTRSEMYKAWYNEGLFQGNPI